MFIVLYNQLSEQKVEGPDMQFPVASPAALMNV
jgi:hypothetical protein